MRRLSDRNHKGIPSPIKWRHQERKLPSGTVNCGRSCQAFISLMCAVKYHVQTEKLFERWEITSFNLLWGQREICKSQVKWKCVTYHFQLWQKSNTVSSAYPVLFLQLHFHESGRNSAKYSFSSRHNMNTLTLLRSRILFLRSSFFSQTHVGEWVTRCWVYVYIQRL